MGIVSSEVVFKGKAPSLTCIAEKITEISSLDLSIKEFELETQPRLYDFYAYISFSLIPHNHLKIYAYRSGAIRKFYLKSHNYLGLSIINPSIEGFNEPIDTQTVYLRMYLGQEPTLFYMTIFALEALDGSLKHPISEDIRDKYQKLFTQSQIQQRYWQNSFQILLIWSIVLILLPILIPLWILQFLVFLIRLSNTIREDRRNNWNNRNDRT
jgi:hypothetical protein